MPPLNPTREISLNIIAISVFTLMASSLLRPLLHFSTLIPAVIVLGLIVGASLDSFFFQSRWAGLLLDVIARRDPDYAHRIVYHEAGHFLLARLSEIPVTGYSLSAWEAWQQGLPGQGGIVFAPPPSPISAQVLQTTVLSGWQELLAEQLIYGNSWGGNDDRQQLRGILNMTGFNASAILKAENEALVRAQQQIVNHRSTFDALVQAFQERRTVPHVVKL